ncbi:MAG: ArnT family glycosyltransferase [Candidatus Nitrosomaritimum yanchengensis]
MFPYRERNETRAKFSGVIFISTILMGIVSAGILYLVDENSFLYYGDAASHLYSSRKFVDSERPGLIQTGTVWLPLPHLMMLPVSLVDSLFSSGLAGLINLPLHALTSVLIYKIIISCTKKQWIALVGGMLYASNPNLLYLSITAMTEAPFLLFFVASVYFLQKWLAQDTVRFRNVFFASFFVFLATLCKYEAWILAPVLVILAAIIGIKKYKDKRAVIVILISLVSFAGIAFWAGWNQITYGNLLEFANTQFYAASSQAVERPYRDFLYLQPQNVLYIYGAAAAMISGPILLGFSGWGYYSHLKQKIKTYSSSIFFYMSLPALFTLTTMFIGIGEMSQWWFNARFATFLTPLVIILASVALLKLEKIKKKIIFGIIASLFVFQIASPAFGVVTYLDAYSGWIYKQAPYAKETSDFLFENYDGGKILIMTGSSQAHRIMISSGASLIDFNEGIESFLYEQYFKEPWNHNKWIVIGKDPDSDSVNAVKFWSDNKDKLDEHYDLVYHNQYYQVLKLK